MLERRILAFLAAANDTNATNSSSSDCLACGPILNDAAICFDEGPLCDAAQCLDEDGGAGAFGMYVILWRCGVHSSPFALIFLIPWLLMLLLALGSTADNFLMPQLNYLSELLRLRPDVAGVTLLAFGNGAPDVFSAIAVARQHQQEARPLVYVVRHCGRVSRLASRTQ